MMRVRSAVALVFTMVSMLACGADGGGDVATEAGVVNGKAVDWAGKPLVDAEIVILGTATESGEDVALYPRTKADGTYSVKVPDGNYSVSGRHTVTWEGRQYGFDLHPGDDHRGKSYPSADGITQNFTLKIAGLRPDSPPGQEFSYYGGTVNLEVSDVYYEGWQTNHFATEFPNGFTFEVTFTPVGTLLDGSTGQPVVATRQVTRAGEADFKALDVPIGKYTVTGVAKKPSGETRTLQIKSVGFTAVNPPAPSAPYSFEPDSSRVKIGYVTFVYGAPYPP